MSLENRVSVVEEAVLIMKDLLVSHDERLESYFNALNESRQDFAFKLDAERREREESRKDFEFKLNALIDAQIRNQDEISKLKEASQSVLTRVEKLESE